MASRDLEELHFSIKKKAYEFLLGCKLEKIDILISCTYRSSLGQKALHAQGRKSLEEVNKLRSKIGLYLLKTEKENVIVTNAKPGRSMHEYRLAFDVVPLIAGKPIWDSKNPLWKMLGEIGKKCGLEWAGDWTTFKEYPHFQYTGGLSLTKIIAGSRPT